MDIDWAPLRVELAHWERKKMTLPVWWRDDDAHDATPALDRLIKMSNTLNVPVHLAIIPRKATRALATRIMDEKNIVPLVHGWAHRNANPADTVRCEFPDSKDIAQTREEILEAKRRLEGLLPGKVEPVFVPPWNRIGGKAAAELADLGFKILSATPNQMAMVDAPGVVQMHAHIDPIVWKDGKALRDPEAMILEIVTMLKPRRQGKSDNSMPFGFLTHHLAMSDEVWAFTESFWQEILKGPVEITNLSKQ